MPSYDSDRSSPFRLTSQRSSTRRSASKINRLTGRVEWLEDENRELKAENVDLRDEITRLKHFHRGVSEAYRRVSEHRERLHAQVQARDNEIRQLQREVARHQNRGDLRRLQQEAEESQVKSNEIRRLREEKSRITREKDDEFERLRQEAITTVHDRDSKIQNLQGELAKMQKKDDEIRRLQTELVKYKGAISASNSTEGQLSDAVIREKLNELFYAVRDWAMELSRQDQLVAQITDPEMAETLYHQIPCLQEGTSKQKMHALIATFSLILVQFMNKKYVFGYCSDDRVESANHLSGCLEEIHEVTKQRKKQWVTLTNNILSKDVENSQKAFESTLASFVNLVEKSLRQVFGFTFSSDNMVELKAAIKPHMHVIFALHLQEADYGLAMLSAIEVMGEDIKPQIYNADKMEDSSGEDEGILQASYFPMIFKEISKDDGKVERVVICKAKVVVAP
ncbi:hypothetical protein KCU67_g5489, partial [Aureobasidium melanogenum]